MGNHSVPGCIICDRPTDYRDMVDVCRRGCSVRELRRARDTLRAENARLEREIEMHGDKHIAMYAEFESVKAERDQLGRDNVGWVETNAQIELELHQARAEVEKLRAALRESIELHHDVSSQAPEWSKDKHGYSSRLERVIDALGTARIDSARGRNGTGE